MSLPLMLVSLLSSHGESAPPSHSALATAILYCFQEYRKQQERPWVIDDSNIQASTDRLLKKLLVPKGIWFAGDSFDNRSKRTPSYCFLSVEKYSQRTAGEYQVSVAILNATGDPLVQREVYPKVLVVNRHGKWMVDRRRSTVLFGSE